MAVVENGAVNGDFDVESGSVNRSSEISNRMKKVSTNLAI